MLFLATALVIGKTVAHHNTPALKLDSLAGVWKAVGDEGNLCVSPVWYL